jgi:hypothetical protein
MNPNIISKVMLRKWAVCLVLLMIPAHTWAQSRIYIPPKVYNPPKVYTPPKSDTPHPASQPKTKTSQQSQSKTNTSPRPQRQQSQVQQPREKKQRQQREVRQPKEGRRELGREQKRERNREKQARQEQKRQLKEQQRGLKRQRGQERQQAKAQRNQQKKAAHQRRQESPDVMGPRMTEPGPRNEPPGRKTAIPGGGHSIDTASGAHYNFSRDGKLASFSKAGMGATFRPDGNFRSLKANGMLIDHGPMGKRTVQTQLSGGWRVVSTGPHQGFVDRPLIRAGHAYVQRTYMANGRTYVSVYRTYYFHGALIYHYVPAFYYAPGFYGWVYYPWGAPVAFNWGFFGAPWFAFSGSYFAPYPAYPAASLWLTDYLLAQDLQSAYQERPEADLDASSPSEASAQGDDGSPVTSEIKLAIAQEVRQQIAAEQNEAVNPVDAAAPGDGPTPPALDPKQRVFVVSSSLSEDTSDGMQCGLTPGDVITRLTDTPDTNQNVLVSVLSSKKGDCAAGSQVTASVHILQEMHNRFQEQVDGGLATLAQDQGKDGFPAGPAAYPQRVLGGQPGVPDAVIEPMLQQQQQDADQVETQVHQAIQADSAGRDSL